MVNFLFILQNEYLPPDWLSFLQVLVNRITNGDANELSFLFHLLGTAVEVGQSVISRQVLMLLSSVVGAIAKHLPPIPDPWPQVPCFQVLFRLLISMFIPVF